MSCDALTQQSCHVSGQVPSCRFFGVIDLYHVVSPLLVSWHVLSSNLVLCVVPVLQSCCILLSLLVSWHGVLYIHKKDLPR